MDNTGSVCIDDSGEVRVTFSTCISSAIEPILPSCSATIDGDVITVDAHTWVTQPEYLNDDCSAMVATCPLPDGADPAAVSLNYAGKTVSAHDACCMVAYDTGCTPRAHE